MAIKVNGTTVVNNDRKGEFNVTNPGQFTTAERDALSPASGDTIFNTEESELQVWNGEEWVSGGGSSDIRVPPVFNDLTLSEDPPGTGRFTDQEFKLTYSMAADGIPASIKGVKGSVIAEFADFPETDASTNVSKAVTISSLQEVNPSPSWSDWKNSYAFCNVFDKWSSNSPKFLAFSIDQYYTRWKTCDPDTWQITDTVTNVYPDGVSGYDLNQGFITCNGRYFNTFSGYDFKSVSFDLKDFFTTGYPTKGFNTSYAQTTGYKYRLNGSTLYRLASDGSSLGYISFSSSEITQSTMCELGPTSAIVLGKYSNNDFRYYIFSDSTTFNNQQVSTSSIGYGGAKGYCKHKNKLFISVGGNMISIDENGTVLTKSLPSDISDARVSSDELNGKLLITKTTVELPPTYPTGNYTLRTFVYGSNNEGASWTQDAISVYVKNSGSYQNPGECGPIWFMPKAKAFMNDKDYNANYRLLGYDGYYQTVVVPNSSSLDDFTQNAWVRPASWDVNKPEGYGLLTSFYDNGDGTSTLNIYGGADYTIGDKVSLTSSTGQSEATQYLVIDSTGRVTDLSTTEQDYQDIGSGNTKKLTFPSTFPTGKTPDEELPAGTILQCYGRAINEVGTSLRSSNAIVPGTEVPSKFGFGLSAFEITNGAAIGVNGGFRWWSDDAGDITNTSDETADGIWRDQYGWINKAPSSSSYTELFSNAYIKELYPCNIEFTFTATDELQNKVIEFGVYGNYSGPSGPDMYSVISTSTPGCSVYANESNMWRQANPEPKQVAQSVIINNPGVTEVKVNFEVYMEGSDEGPNTYVKILYWRLKDISGDEIETEKPS